MALAKLRMHCLFYLMMTIICLMIGSCSKSMTANRKVHQKDSGAQIIEQVQIDTAGKIAKIVFDSSSYHFGVLKQGEVIHREIQFTNLGTGDLLIELMSACECTTLDWSRLPVKPGKKSSIKIAYNSKDKEGPQIVDIDITANTQPISTFTKFYLLVEK